MTHELFGNRPVRWQLITQPAESPTSQLGDCSAFGCVRGDRDHAFMLEIRHANGNIAAYSYGLLDSSTFNPSIGIALSFSGVRVKLMGRNLNNGGDSILGLFEGIIRHRVVWVQEACESLVLESNEDAVVIEAISIT